ncbi:hypothetical protein [Coxiella-like endosymbiont of Rhipicephalus sanguineus]|uniref:hypothetical protein n=1 Tax=Coxiella-like endosymbiont of Rhipicephalus sanguineus TaxID=1955402 RepID=UPI002040F74F|nr:hypothetical protein [Coxiella-like endosymbiont of Rhipicephalus sanguineus]
MPRYESLKTIKFSPETTFLRSYKLPELVHLDDPALAVMTDFSQIPRAQSVLRNPSMMP